MRTRTHNLRKKKAVSISVDDDLLKWIDQLIKTKRFAHRSHAFEYAIERLKEEYEKKT